MPEFTPWSPPPQSSPIQTLSGLLGVQQQQQALQTGQATQSSAQSAASIAGQTAKENQNLAKLIADPVGNGIANPDGTPTDKAADIYMAAAPTTWGQHYDNLVATAQRKVEFNNTVNNLKTNERAEVANTVAGAASGAQSPQDIKDAVANLVATKQGTPLAADYQKISGLVNAQLDHVTQATQGRNPMPPGQEPWRTAALNIGASVLPAAQTAGVGGLGRPQQGTNAAGQNQLVSPVTGARSNPQLVGGATNPASPQVAGQAAAATAAGTLPYVAPTAAASAAGAGVTDIDVARSRQVGDLQQQSAAAITLTKQADALKDALDSGVLAKKISETGNYLGFSSVNEARSQLVQDLGKMKGLVADRAGSDSRANTILEGYPSDTTPNNTFHADMDYIRGTGRQNLARGQLLSQYQNPKDPNAIRGFAAADNMLTATADPLVHEFTALKPAERAGFYTRNFSTPQQAQAFKDRVTALQRHTSVVPSQ